MKVEAVTSGARRVRRRRSLRRTGNAGSIWVHSGNVVGARPTPGGPRLEGRVPPAAAAVASYFRARSEYLPLLALSRSPRSPTLHSTRSSAAPVLMPCGSLSRSGLPSNAEAAISCPAPARSCERRVSLTSDCNFLTLTHYVHLIHEACISEIICSMRYMTLWLGQARASKPFAPLPSTPEPIDTSARHGTSAAADR
jgi:hypothetical protein